MVRNIGYGPDISADFQVSTQYFATYGITHYIYRPGRLHIEDGVDGGLSHAQISNYLEAEITSQFFQDEEDENGNIIPNAGFVEGENGANGFPIDMVATVNRWITTGEDIGENPIEGRDSSILPAAGATTTGIRTTNPTDPPSGSSVSLGTKLKMLIAAGGGAIVGAGGAVIASSGTEIAAGYEAATAALKRGSQYLAERLGRLARRPIDELENKIKEGANNIADEAGNELKKVVDHADEAANEVENGLTQVKNEVEHKVEEGAKKLKGGISRTARDVLNRAKRHQPPK
ncbi:hypothetical protein DLAC_06131 [Tieghemostelium lacteum]|uniref:Uncharacterized protein n=1 Tax=Tieghemostelium lacteum TaxID=361077 RepID=A0A151ZHU1_TIELA|nr:hypothetical protein DLAC_06131 [Tieghemostelium lacteum]|eukprot:KYQ93440.1 hypothetical protein DLAC_06131 [Tieghemostelium lacteum]